MRRAVAGRFSRGCQTTQQHSTDTLHVERMLKFGDYRIGTTTKVIPADIPDLLQTLLRIPKWRKVPSMQARAPLSVVICFSLLFAFITSIAAVGQTSPNITSISPIVGPVAPVGGSVTIQGSGFGGTQGSSTVSFGGVVDTPTSWSDGQIVVPVPSTLPTGFASVFVTVNGTPSNTASFIVIPVITQLSPEQGIIGSSVMIQGTSFGDQQGSSTITFNGIPASPTTWSNTSITAAVPIGASVGPVVVTVNGFQTNGATFFVLPNITGISPAVASAGSLVTILGSGFGQTQGFGGVTFSNEGAAVQFWSDTSITVAVPHDVSAGYVVVTTGLLLTSNGVNFTPIFPFIVLDTFNHGSNTAGWFNSPVTINYQCSGGITPITCPPSQTVSTEGANQVITATAIDGAGNNATASTIVNLDLTPPNVSISAPSNGITVFNSPVRISGLVSDTLSGVSSVTCNGTAASLSSGSYICNVALTSGSNTVQVQAADAAGNVANSNAIAITYNPIPPTAIFITPGTANMLVGNTRSVRLVGNVGQSVSGATWTTSDPTIVSITTDDPPQLSAIAQGTATLSASFGQLQASMTLNVFSGQSLPFGTPLWSVAPVTGGSLTSLVPALPMNQGDPDIYMVDGETTLDALTADGQLLWAVNLASGPSTGGNGAIVPLTSSNIARSVQRAQTVLPASSDMLNRLLNNPRVPYPFKLQILGQQQRIALRLGKKGAAKTNSQQATGAPSNVNVQPLDASTGFGSLLMQTVADNSGHAINLVFDCLNQFCDPFTPAIIAVDNGTQAQLWETDLNDGPYVGISSLAIAPDNTVYLSGIFQTGTADSSGNVPTHSSVIAIDGTTGQTKFDLPVDPSHTTFTLTDSSGNLIDSEDIDVATAIGPMAVMPDGSVQTMLSSAQKNDTETQAHPPCNVSQTQCSTAISNHLKLQLLAVQPGGSSSSQQVRSYDFDSDSNCGPACIDPGAFNSYSPGDLIPDGLGGTLAAWTENDSGGPTFNLSQNIRHVGTSGAVQDFSFPGLIPTNLAADQGEFLVLGENNVAFGVGTQIVGFNVTNGTQVCNTPFLSPNGASLVAPTSDGGLLATQLNAPIFGNSVAFESFDSSCTPTTFSLPSALSEVRFLNPSTVLGVSSGPLAEAFQPPISTATTGGTAFLPDGNPSNQRASAAPAVDSIDRGRALIGDTVTVTLKGSFGANPSINFDAGITATVSSADDKQIVASFAITANAKAGKHTFTVSDDRGKSSGQTFFVQTPASLKVLNVAVLQDGPDPPSGCRPSLPYGIMVDIQYQVLDQDAPNPQPIQSANMTPHEKGNLFKGEPADSNIGPVPGYPTSGQTTAPDGTFHDVPYGLCSAFPISLPGRTATQNITMIVPNQNPFAVRSQTATVTAPGVQSFEHGTITNTITSPGSGSDINAMR